MATVAARLSILIATVAVAAAGAQNRDIRRETTGTSSLAGMVLAADGSKAPLRRALVTVTGGALVTPRETVTDDAGRFLLPGLTAGQYSLVAQKTGYLKVSYGATRPARLGTTVVVAEGQRVTGLSIALPRGGVITGTVSTAAGEPDPEVSVTALHWRMWNGERTLVPAASARTDERGEYRLTGLDRGDYLVALEPSADEGRGPAEIFRIPEGAVDRVLSENRASSSTVEVTRAIRVQPLGPAPVFYPGTVRPADASTVTVKAGEERRGVDIRTELVPMARLTGVVTGDGQPAANVRVVLTSLGPPAPNFAYAIGGRLGPKTTDAAGRFTFTGVPPGEYRLEVSTRLIAGRRGGPPPDPNPRMAFQTVEVNGVDRELSLPLGPAMAMRGRFVFDGAGPPPVSHAGTQVTLEGLNISPGWEVNIYRADSSADGSFHASGLTPGRYMLNATASGSTPASGWALKSTMSQGRDLLDAPFELAPGEIHGDVVVTFTDQPARLAGTLQTSAGIPATDYFIVVFSTDSRFWFGNSRRIMAVRPDTSGAYAARNLPPGDYFVAAVTDVETGEWFDPGFLKTLAESSPLRIAIRQGQELRQDLRVGK